jgi:hypothetical protein
VRDELLVVLVPLARESVDVGLDVTHEVFAAGGVFGIVLSRDQPLVIGQRSL